MATSVRAQAGGSLAVGLPGAGNQAQATEDQIGSINWIAIATQFRRDFLNSYAALDVMIGEI